MIATSARIDQATRVDRAGAAIATVTVAIVLLQLAAKDGGLPDAIAVRVGWLLLLVTPLAFEVLAELPSRVSVTLGVWGMVGIGALGAAPIAHDGAVAAFAYAAAPLAGLVALRIWRAGGRAVLLTTLAAVFVVSWWSAFLAYFGLVSGGGVVRWLALSWHSQSGALMAAFGALFAALAMRNPSRVLAVLAGAGSAMAIAGVWLSGSRAALLALLVGVVAAMIMRRSWAALVAVMIGASMIVALLGSIPSATDATVMGVGDRGQAATTSLWKRFDHMKAAVGMFAAQPMTGHGLGAFEHVAADFYGDVPERTIYAHNEWLEPFAEGGIVLGLAGLTLLGGALLGVGRVARAGRVSGPETAGMAAMFVVLAAHALIDFDFLYPLLAVLMGISGFVAYAAHRSGEPIGSWWWALPVPALMVLALLI